MGRDRTSRPEAAPLRLFVAVEIPEEAKRSVLEAFAPWREAFPRARWVPPENWHVTVRFLGRTWPRVREWVEARMGEVAGVARPYRATLSRVGSFPSARTGRVLWAGLEDDGATGALAAALDDALAEEFAPERRAFHPHLTVARSDPPVKLPEGYHGTPLVSEPWDVGALVLFRSHLRRPAPVYEPIGRFPLGTGTSGAGV